MIPQMYFDYLRSGDARPLTNVFYHNSMDVLALAALLNHATHLLEDPLHGTVEHYLDQYAIGRLFEDLGRWDEAVELYRRSLDDEAKYDPAVRDNLIEDILRRLSFLHKRRGELSMAVDLWKQAAHRQHLYAYVELAKYYEHNQRDYNEAIHWTQSALELVGAPGLARFERLQWQPDLDHRLARLYKKAGPADE
jgi:tetratricopeptide (TPR) repeat protein